MQHFQTGKLNHSDWAQIVEFCINVRRNDHVVRQPGADGSTEETSCQQNTRMRNMVRLKHAWPGHRPQEEPKLMSHRGKQRNCVFLSRLQAGRKWRTCSSVSCFEMVSFSIFLIFFMSLLTWNSCSCSRCCSNSAFSCWSCSGRRRMEDRQKVDKTVREGKRGGGKKEHKKRLPVSHMKSIWWPLWTNTLASDRLVWHREASKTGSRC